MPPLLALSLAAAAIGPVLPRGGRALVARRLVRPRGSRSSARLVRGAASRRGRRGPLVLALAGGGRRARLRSRAAARTGARAARGPALALRAARALSAGGPCSRPRVGAASGLRVTFLDVGQGDGDLLEVPRARCSSTRARPRPRRGPAPPPGRPLADGDRLTHRSATTSAARRACFGASRRAVLDPMQPRRRASTSERCVAAAREPACRSCVRAGQDVRARPAPAARALAGRAGSRARIRTPRRSCSSQLRRRSTCSSPPTPSRTSRARCRCGGRGPEGRAPRLGGPGLADELARPAPADRRDLRRARATTTATRGAETIAALAAARAWRLPHRQDGRVVVESDGRSCGRTERLEYGRRHGDRPELKPVYLISGSDRPKVELALSAAPGTLRARVDRAVSRGRGLAASSRSPPATREPLRRRAARRRHRGRRPTRTTATATGGWKAADIEAVVAYLAAPAPGTVLASSA